MENSNILYFPVRNNKHNDFDLMHNLLRYVYAKNTTALNIAEVQEHKALQHTYFSRAALKRRLKQIAMHAHEQQN